MYFDPKKYFIVFLCGFFSVVQAQQKLDSLIAALPNQKDTNKVQVLDQISICYSNFDNQKYLDYSLLALKEAEKTKNKFWIANENLQVGNAYTSIGDYSKAIFFALKAYKLFDQLKSHRKAGKAANVLGNLYLGQQNFIKAREYYQLVLSIGKKNKNDYGISVGYLGLSNVFSEQKQLDSSLYFIALAEKGFLASGHKMEYLAVAINKSSILHELKRFDEAYANFTKILPEVEALQDKYFTAGLYTNLGNTLKSMRKYPEALSYFKKALVLNIELKSLDDKKEVYRHLAELYSLMKQADSAYHYLELHVMMKDSFFLSENIRQMNELEGKFQLDKKNAEIKAKNAIIKSSEAESALKDAENRRKGLIIWFSIGGLIVALVLFIVVYRSNVLRKRAYSEVSLQKQIIEGKNKEIIDSISYAKRIQGTLLASDQLLKNNLNDYFIFYQPKDIVSGDFYWATEVENHNGDKFFNLCTADCTGHGVPGAFMSLLCISFLNEITRDRKWVNPNEIFSRLKKEIVRSLNPEKAIQTRDGMDAVLCCFDFKNRKLILAAANNPVLILRNNNWIEIKPDKNPIGKYEQTGFDYTLHEIDLQKNDIVYTFTDGYADQFGGQQHKSGGKKYKYKRLREFLMSNGERPMKEQGTKLQDNFIAWKGDLEQLDDILVIGVKIA